MNQEVGPGWSGKEPPMHWVSCDPGEIHSGFARWSRFDCIETRSLSGGPNGSAVAQLLQEISNGLDFLVFERYTLYPHLARQQAGSEFLTSQQIGAMKFIVTHKEIPWQDQTAGQGKRVYSLEPFRSWSQRSWKSYGMGPHAKDAEAHGYSWLLKQFKYYPGMP